MNFLPLWTATVWPTNSGGIVERRDQVLSTFFCRVRFSSSIRSSSVGSMYGPFFSERPIPPLLFLPSRHDEAIRRSGAAPGLVTLRRLAPWGHRMVALALALAAAHRMIDGIHHRAADRRTEAAPADPPRLADRDVLVVEVADLADGRHAPERDQPHLAGWQLERRAVALLRQELGLSARAPAELRAAAGLELDVVDERADRDVPHRQRVPGQDVRLRARHEGVPDPDPERGDDVALLTVPVVEQGQARRAVRIVLDRGDARGDAVFLPPEIDPPQHLFGAAAAMPDGDPPVDVATVRPALGQQQPLFRLVLRDVVVRDVREVAQRRRRRLDGADGHAATPPRRVRSCGPERASRSPSSSRRAAPRNAPCASASPRTMPSGRRPP